MSLLSDNIRRLRTLRGLTQKQLANMLGISAKTISKWETGSGQPDINQIVPLSRVFGVSIDALFLGAKTLAGPNQSDIEESQSIQRTLEKIQVQHSIPIKLLLQLARADEQDLKDLMEGKAPIGQQRRERHDRLIKLILVLSDLIPRYVADIRLLIATLYTKLRAENELPAEAIESYVHLKSGSLGAYINGNYPLTQKAICELIVTLFILDNTINQGESFPCDD